MQVRIRKEELEAFKLEASDVVSSKDNQPVLQFLRIQVDGDFATITKSNDRAFVHKTIPNDSEDCTFLVDEATVYDFMNACDGDYIQFESNGTRILISSGRAKIFSPTEQAHLYPTIDLSNDNFVVLPKLACSTAGVCSKIVMNGELMNAQSHVFLGNNFVCGADGNIGYFQNIDEVMPKLVLRKEVAVCVSKIPNCLYGFNTSWDLFKAGQTLFGFKKSELKFFDPIEGIFRGKLDTLTADFSVNKNQILKFTALCIARAPKTTAATFEVIEPNMLHMELCKNADEVDIHMDIPVKGINGSFKFDPAVMTSILKAIPCDDIYFYEGQKLYFLTDLDKSFTSIIMAII